MAGLTEQRVLEFIHRRFPQDCNWKNGNCYFFAVILKSRFPEGIILYDVIDGHFVTHIDGQNYDWSGVVSDEGKHYYVEWDYFDEYDSNQKKSVIDGCIL